MARFDDAEQHPAIVEKSFGRGKVLLFASSADSEWNNWPKRPSYVVSIQELGHYAAKPNQRRTDLICGGPIRMTLDPARYQPEAVLRTPAYPAEAEALIHASPAGDGQTYELFWPKVDQVGIYRLLLTPMNIGAGQQEERPLAANLDRAESNLDSCNEADLRRSAPEIKFDYVTDVGTLAHRSDEGLREFWPALLIAVIALLMLEQTLACWFGNVETSNPRNVEPPKRREG